MRHPLSTKRRFAVLSAIGATVLALSACGTESDAPGVGDSEPQQRECEGPDGDYLIGMSQANDAEPYREQMNDDIEAAASKVPQFEVEFTDAAQDNSKQVSDVRALMTQQIDLLMISPNEAAPLTGVVAEAYNKGIPVIVLDRKVEGDAYTQFIGADNYKIGKRAGEYVANELLPNGGNVVELKGLPGSTPAQEREEGFAAGIKSNPDVEIIATGVGNWLRAEGRTEAEAIFKAHDDIDVVYSQNDPMAEGAYLAAKSAGIADEIEITGIDGLPIPSGGLKAVEAGRLSATFVYPTGGEQAVETAKDILIECKDVPKKIELETQLVTKKNAMEVYRKNSTE